MVKLVIVQTKSYTSNKQGIKNVSKILESLGKKETDIVCLPEQWLQNNRITSFEREFSEFTKIAKKFKNKVSLENPDKIIQIEILGGRQVFLF